MPGRFHGFALGAVRLLQAEWWGEAKFINLKAIKRQSDRSFIAVLDDMRFGRQTQRVQQFLERCLSNPQKFPMIVGRRADAEEENKAQQMLLPGDASYYPPQTSSSGPEGKELLVTLMQGSCCSVAVHCWGGRNDGMAGRYL